MGTRRPQALDLIDPDDPIGPPTLRRGRVPSVGERGRSVVQPAARRA